MSSWVQPREHFKLRTQSVSHLESFLTTFGALRTRKVINFRSFALRKPFPAMPRRTNCVIEDSAFGGAAICEIYSILVSFFHFAV